MIRTRYGEITYVGHGTVRITGVFALAMWTIYAALIVIVSGSIFLGIYRI